MVSHYRIQSMKIQFVFILTSCLNKDNLMIGYKFVTKNRKKGHNMVSHYRIQSMKIQFVFILTSCLNKDNLMIGYKFVTKNRKKG